MTTIDKASEYLEAAAEADKAGQAGMVLVYLRKARDYFADAGDDAMAARCEAWIESR